MSGNHEVNDVAPSSIKHLVGQRGVIDQVSVAIDAAFADSRKLDHALLVGPPGLHPHLLRHTMAHRFLEDNPGDLVSLAQILGHSNINTTALYCQRTQGQLGEASEKLNY